MIRSDLKIGYSLAILDIAKEEKKEKQLYNQSLSILNALEEQEEFEKILDSNIDPKSKKNIIEKTFKGYHWVFINVAQILSQKNIFKYFKDILKKLIIYLQEILGIEQGILYSTKLVSSEQLKKLETKISKEYNKKISLKNLVDKELIGGFKIVLGSTIIEDSVKSELNSIKDFLISKEEGGV